jgi:hypothetical protein
MCPFDALTHISPFRRTYVSNDIHFGSLKDNCVHTDPRFLMNRTSETIISKPNDYTFTYSYPSAFYTLRFFVFYDLIANLHY